MRRRISPLLTIFILSIPILYTDPAWGYLFNEVLMEIKLHLEALINILDNLPAHITLSPRLIQTISFLLSQIEILLQQVGWVYDDHTLIVVNDYEGVIHPSQFPIDHREQPLIICHIRRLIATIRTELNSLPDIPMVDLQ